MACERCETVAIKSGLHRRLVASKGAFRAENEMGDPGAGLVGGHGYCTQDLVNLALIAGDAVSFGGVRKLGSRETLLEGIKRRSDAGLTLLEGVQVVPVANSHFSSGPPSAIPSSPAAVGPPPAASSSSSTVASATFGFFFFFSRGSAGSASCLADGFLRCRPA